MTLYRDWNTYEEMVKARGMFDMAMAKANGLDNAEPRTPQSSTPTSFRQ